MKKMMGSRFYLLAAALVTLAACGSDKDMAPAGEEQVSLQVTGSINGLKARVANNQWEDGDRIGVSGTSGNLTYTNVPYRYDAVNDFQPAADILYLGAASGTFNAYHPYVDTDQPITKNIADQGKSLDFLYAKDVTVSRDAPTLALTFNHQMSLLKLHMEAGTGFTNADFSDNSKFEVKLSEVHSTATFDIASGEVTAGGNQGITLRPTVYEETTDGQKSYYFLIILCPETIQNGIQFSFVKDNVSYDGQLTTNDGGADVMAMESGKVYEYTITVSKTGVNLSPVAINDWTAAWPDSKKVNASI